MQPVQKAKPDVGFKTIEVKCPSLWKSPNVTVWLNSSGFCKVVAVTERADAVRVATTFARMIRRIRGFKHIRILPDTTVRLSEYKL